MTACTSEIGASASAATWKHPGDSATANPIAHHLERKSAAALASGRRMSMSGAATAPRCFQRKARLVANAQASASSSPI